MPEYYVPAILVLYLLTVDMNIYSIVYICILYYAPQQFPQKREKKKKKKKS